MPFNRYSPNDLESGMICPIHRYQNEGLIEDGCPECNKINQVVIDCELDKVDRALSTMREQGYNLQPACEGTHVILVFRKE